jgi:hypothetical protein
LKELTEEPTMELRIPFLSASPTKTRRVRASGYNPMAEALLPIMLAVGPTFMVIIACWVLAQENITALLSGHATPEDLIVVFLVLGLGLMTDGAMIISVTRLRMHVTRGARDRGWALISGVMFFICLGVESVTLLYFGYTLLPPSSEMARTLSGFASWTHNLLFFVRFAFPPLVIAYFAAGVMALTIEPSDLDQVVKAITSLGAVQLIERLVQVAQTDSAADRQAGVEAFIKQIELYEWASHATPVEVARNRDLFRQLRGEGSSARALGSVGTVGDATAGPTPPPQRGEYNPYAATAPGQPAPISAPSRAPASRSRRRSQSTPPADVVDVAADVATDSAGNGEQGGSGVEHWFEVASVNDPTRAPAVRRQSTVAGANGR